MKKYNISINDMSIDYRDCGPWRSYSLEASGSNLEELIQDITIAETDQDGGELRCYGLEDASNEIEEVALSLIKASWLGIASEEEGL